jgi:alpha/beta superfamily hydrolase
MNALTERLAIAGPAGELACAVDAPAPGVPLRGVAVLCHPHPLHGGTMDNKVVQTLARAAVLSGWRAVRFNFRGIGGSAGSWDAARALADAGEAAERLVLIGPAVVNFEVAPVPADTLVVHGEVDDVVPLVAVLDWARPQTLPVTVLPGAGHFFHGLLPTLRQIVVGALAARAL